MMTWKRSWGMLLCWIVAAGCGADEAGTQAQREAVTSSGCTLTQGYWKNHPGVWPVGSLTLGTVSYSEAQLLSILGQAVKGNGLVDLAHQLIAAKLNVAAGANPSAISATITAADNAIGSRVVPPVGSGSLSTSSVSALVDALDAYNSGRTGPGHCGDTPPPPVCGNGILESGEQCDDGNLVNGDGCSSTCTNEPPPPVCGNGILESGEQCDDGNLDNGDGCSCTCTIETPPPPPVCGNGILEAGEQCDDGNLDNGDGCSCTCTLETLPQ